MTLPQQCCKNVGTDMFKACGEQAKYWYKHGEDICSYCEVHNYACGEPIKLECEECSQIIPGTFIVCGEGGNYCSDYCYKQSMKF